MSAQSIDLNFSISLKLDKVSLQNLNEDLSIKEIKSKLCDVWKKEIENFNFIYKGQILNDSSALKDLGVLSGSMIYCLPKNDVEPPSAVPLSLIEVQQLLVSLRAAIARSNFRVFIQKLRTPEQSARLISECPALCKDPAALAYVQDADLVKALQNATHLTKVLEKKPVIGRVLQIICNLITSDATSPDRSRHVNYSLDTLSDEEMDVDVNNDNSSRGSGSSSQFITSAQLAAALASASGSGGGWGSSSTRSEINTPSSTPSNTPAAPASRSEATGGASPGGPMITTEMFSQALQNAFAVSSRPVGTSETGTGSTAQTNQPLENVEESLQLMSEMGIPDRELSLQALQASNGDVQAAVNFIFSQWMADD